MNKILALLLAASCLTAVGQSEYCLDGTVWDEAMQGCVPESVDCEVEFDFDEDGYVGTGDLLTFLTAFGSSLVCCDADYNLLLRAISLGGESYDVVESQSSQQWHGSSIRCVKDWQQNWQ